MRRCSRLRMAQSLRSGLVEEGAENNLLASVNKWFSLPLTTTCVHFPARLLPVAVKRERKKEWKKERWNESFFWALCSAYCRLCLPACWGRVGSCQVSASTKANNERYYCLTFIVSSDKCGYVVFLALLRFRGFSLFPETKEARSVVLAC